MVDKKTISEEIQENLAELCADILTWHKTGRLPAESKVRTLASRLPDDDFALHTIENEVREKAMQHIVNLKFIADQTEKYEEL